ncbi:globin domain-containing protein [Streptomyces spectabilis]|uniref:nitric oxide dioxygenase n=1 Tax=Streptomyces spectabilis TaxID=68270 RepID=A0A516RA46_STRST|nr:globin domain-containing protein [Streptomyces spectabilis]QDQ12527.1 flavohemoprotein [Streptomyces spectabilis]
MFEARHSMDAPTTTSASNGTSGHGGGWFTPRRPPERPEAAAGSDRGADGPDHAEQGQGGPEGGHHQAPEGRRVATIRPLGRPAAGAVEDEVGRIPPAGSASPDPTPEAAQGLLPETSLRTVAAPSRQTVAESASKGPEDTEVGAADGGTATLPAPEGEAEALVLGAAGEATAGPPVPEEAVTATADAGPDGSAPVRPDSPQASPGPAPSPDAVLVQRTMAEIAPIADKVTSYFYALLFTRHPDLRALFPAAMDTQRDRLLAALLTAAEHIDETDVLVDYLRNLGRGHRKYGTQAEHYPAVGECLIGALSRYAGGVWDGDTEAAWVRTYTTISQVMIDAAAEDELRAPAWWYAEVVAHDLRTPDIAVITVRPDQPYPFLAGQYTSLETPWWPRIWRHYSFASAPRSDGLLSFHVKAIPAGWVSNALVHHARPGDVLRLGPPSGSMTVDHSTDSGLLCLGGGTGIAPIKALVEDVAEHGRRRPVEVFYGARTNHDLYDIDTMLRLQRTHPWLAVRPVVDTRAQLPDAVREYGPWDEYDAYLSGPPGMIRSGVDALREVGIPAGRIRHDSVEELVSADG